jgi:hypothetical protein
MRTVYHAGSGETGGDGDSGHQRGEGGGGDADGGGEGDGDCRAHQRAHRAADGRAAQITFADALIGFPPCGVVIRAFIGLRAAFAGGGFYFMAFFAVHGCSDRIGNRFRACYRVILPYFAVAESETFVTRARRAG